MMSESNKSPEILIERKKQRDRSRKFSCYTAPEGVQFTAMKNVLANNIIKKLPRDAMSNPNAILLNTPHTNPISVTLKSQKAENYHPEKGGVKICLKRDGSSCGPESAW